MKRGEGCERVEIGIRDMSVSKSNVYDRNEFPRSVIVESWNGKKVRYEPVEAWKEGE